MASSRQGAGKVAGRERLIVPPMTDERKGFIETLPKAPFKVVALRMGYYNHVRRREGDVFIVREREHFSEKWMELAHPEAKPSKTGAQAAIQREHDEILGGKVVSKNNQGGVPGYRSERPSGRAQDFDEEFA